MKPRVLFINLPYVVKDINVTRAKVRSFHAFPLGLLSVATYNKQYADIQIIDCDSHENYWNSVVHAMHYFKPVIVGFSMMFDNSYKSLGNLLRLVRSINPDVITVLGGSAASYSYKEILADHLDLNAICYSEGEIPFQDLLLSSTFRNPAWVITERLRRGGVPSLSFIQDLNDVTAIDYSFVGDSNYDMQEAFSPFAKPNRKCFFTLTSRGCFGKCSFCSNASIHGRTVRQASVDAIISHVRHLTDDYGMETLIIYDDQLLYKPNRAKELFRQLAQFHIRIEAPNGVSIRYIDNEMAYLMRAAGMDTIYLALESGSEYVLRELINKPLKLSMVAPAVKALRAADLFIHAFIVLGMPGETDAHRQETRQFLLDSDFDWHGINLATPVRGSKLYRDCIENGWIEKQKIEDIVDKKYIINFPGVDPAEVEQQASEMNIELNFHRNRRRRIGDYKTAALCFEQVLQRYGEHKWAKYYLWDCQQRGVQI